MEIFFFPDGKGVGIGKVHLSFYSSCVDSEPSSWFSFKFLVGIRCIVDWMHCNILSDSNDSFVRG